jgi:tetratricopeptide (TPR) repeat protein
MSRDPALQKALVLARKGRYGEAVKMLEAEVFRHQDSFAYYHTLGTICLYAGDFGGAYTYFTRAKNIRFQDPRNLLGLAFLFLRRGDTGRALDMYLDVQELEKTNPIVRRALGLIKKYGGTGALEEKLGRKKKNFLYPPLPLAGFSPRPLPLIIALLAAATAAGIVLGPGRTSPVQRGGLEISALEQEERKNPVETGGSHRYILTHDQVLAGYGEARELFNKYRDEAAKRELNRILESNASAGIKNKARLLKSYMEIPGFGSLKDRFGYAEVAADPLLYRDCFVLWRGSAANIQGKGERTSFDLLVGYDTRTVMEGTVRVELDFPAELNTREPLEVLGSVVPLAADRFMIRASGVHQERTLSP